MPCPAVSFKKRFYCIPYLSEKTLSQILAARDRAAGKINAALE